MKAFFGSKSRNALVAVLAASLGLHIVAVAVFGTIKFVSAVMREEQTFQAPPIEPPPQKEPEYVVNLQQRTKSSSPPRPKPIVVNNPSEIDIPALNIDVNVDSSSVYGRGGGGFGGGLAGIREMVITADLFGKQVEARRLGVVLDISQSTHSIIHKVVEEIDEAFPDAILAFAPGCMITSNESEIAPIGEYSALKRKYDIPKGLKAAYTTETFVEALTEKNRDFDKIWKEVARQERGYIVFSEIKVTERTNEAFALGGSSVAIEYLASQGVDVIYWFADFNDYLNAGVSKNLLRTLKNKRVKLIMHDFLAPLGPQDATHRELIIGTLKGFAKETSGEFFLKEFK